MYLDFVMLHIKKKKILNAVNLRVELNNFLQNLQIDEHQICIL